MSLALVTGATGLIGSHVVERLLADGWEVRALSRAPESARHLLPSRVDVQHGDVLDESSFARAASSCHVIFHTAANVLARGGWEAYRATNVEGTRNALTAAERSRARLLHISSVAVYGPSGRYDRTGAGRKTDESVTFGPLSERAYYARSKRESEELVLKAHVEGRVWGTAVRPAVVYGKGDRHFVPRMARLVSSFAVPLLRGGRATLGVVHAENVAQGVVLAATQDVAGGKAYNLANDFDVTVRRFFELAGDGVGRRPIFVPIPMWAARTGLRGAKWIARVIAGGKFVMVSNAAIDFISEDNPFSSDLAKQELGWKPTVRPEHGVPEAFRWWTETRRARRESRPGSN
jgi:nucleoside-diphosphate-sugar epimerase